MSDQKREFFRITYTPADHPKLLIGDLTFSIIDISAGGVCYKVSGNQHLPDPSLAQMGYIIFQDGSKIPVAGRIIRIDRHDRSVVLRLAQPLEMKVLMDQHRSWITRHKQSG